ncbi:unnamed protein product [Schistosoma rodhaini]|uniref:RFXA_RFXANK_bdg domain-containing protein n=2 Tax=Schistosoma TaxID=6181 RepID=A0A5K4FAM6_SCHMA|nr:unnamed protein product [Schistosoma rodhaini]CAH8539336.1 unnamed protein product [Schistosoma rodhaini]
MTLEESRNLHQSLPSANFSGSYLTNANQINSSHHYQNSQNPTNYPPLFHPAAVAAVAAAAAAAGYTQQFNPGVISRPLNLTANPNGPNPYFSSADTSRAYYASFALQQSGFYPGSHAFNNLGGMNIPQDFSFPNPTTSIPLSSTGVEFPSCLSTSTTETENGSKLQRVSGSTKNSKTSASSVKTHAKSSGVRGRKSISSDEMANRKRQEFNELVKARTEKLMSDGPIANSSTNSGPLSSSSSAGSTGPESGSPNYRKLIHAVLDAKKSALLRSPSVIHFLVSQQRSLTEYKRQTELFCVTMNR